MSPMCFRVLKVRADDARKEFIRAQGRNGYGVSTSEPIRDKEFPMKFLRPFLLFLALMAAGFGNAFASEKMSASEALERAGRGEIVLVDVRSPDEWRESGVAGPAITLSMHERGFLEGLARLKEENSGKPIAMICATGGRTAFLQKELEKRGLGTVIDVSEGMFGNGEAPGWLARGLPVRKVGG